ncbi:MAG: hypothetical protein QI197_07695 [Candidatus Korarchaeota archaeon]|nr:hypothetical protein [Candidatus Korarchaeota archaeon]
MPGDNLEEIEPLLSWYRRTGHVQVESLGLDGRTIILKIEGRRGSIRSLVALYDPSLDGDPFIWLRDLINSHRRAGIEFDRVEVWTSPEMVNELSAGSEELDESIYIVVRSLSELGSPLSPTPTSLPSEERATSRRTRRPSLRKEESRTIIVVEERKERGSKYEEPNKSREDSLTAILNEIKRTIDQSMKSIIEEVRKGNEIDLFNKIHELEKRVELLEAMIRLLGSQQGTVNLPPAGWAGRSNIPPRLEPTELRREVKREQSTEPEAVRTGEGERVESALGYGHQVNIPSTQGSGGSGEPPITGSEDILEEILSNPWVEILSRKGEDVEG